MSEKNSGAAFVKAILSLVFLLILGLAAAFFYFQMVLQEPVSHKLSEKIFTVARGSSLEETLKQMESDGIIKNALILRLYIKVSGHSPLVKAGDYKFPSPLNAREALAVLEAGGIQPRKLTVIEGWTRFEIADAMVKIPELKLASRKEALKLMDNVKLVQDLDTHVSNLEGYLFPDTYFVQSETTARALVEEMTVRFRQILKKVVGRTGNPGRLSVHEAVTCASIIETEAKLQEERPVVASVIYNRLKLHMPLAMDSTVVYASKLAGKWKGNGIIYQSDLDLPSPYNSRKYKGLPPGPVGCPGESSLAAALNPVRSNFLYYVRDPARADGAHTFYNNAADFEVGVAKLRRWEAEQRSKGLR
ncbi:MAG: endolytic transglycosylase MltG [Candidatus Obscuribacter sp.]|nr:endolytic transglycosylase MltG [Candidatus Obscuribacter sp.]MBK9281947.1 endolytic transglycosylase MltG [Candidatus Obscuribacter sp.]HNG73939.1 endolytic transglycosylase MltG [Candidatus Obscuribacter sp.]